MIRRGVGAITQNDIMLASVDPLIVGFNVRPNAEARETAAREGVEIRTYDVIYKLTEEIEQALVGKLAAVKTRTMARPRCVRSSGSPGSARSQAAWSPTASFVATRASA